MNSEASLNAETEVILLAFFFSFLLIFITSWTEFPAHGLQPPVRPGSLCFVKIDVLSSFIRDGRKSARFRRLYEQFRSALAGRLCVERGYDIKELRLSIFTTVLPLPLRKLLPPGAHRQCLCTRRAANLQLRTLTSTDTSLSCCIREVNWIEMLSL